MNEMTATPREQSLTVLLPVGLLLAGQAAVGGRNSQAVEIGGQRYAAGQVTVQDVTLAGGEYAHVQLVLTAAARPPARAANVNRLLHWLRAADGTPAVRFLDDGRTGVFNPARREV